MKNNTTKILILIAISLFITSSILPREVNNLDEIWNFNFANCIAKGLIPYKDFNIIQGPLISIICSIFLRIFGTEMIVMRFLAIIIDTLVLFMTFTIMDKLKINNYTKYIILIISAFIMKPYFTIDYNWGTLLNILIIIDIEISKKRQEKWSYEILIGFIAGLSIAFKQTTGLIITIATIGYKIFEIRNKNDIKKYIRIALLRTIGALIVPLIMILILLKLGALSEYIDYCILGVTTFSNKISYIDGLIKSSNLIIRTLSISPIIVYISLIYMYIKKQKSEILTLIIFSIISMILVYPISDEAHFVVAIPATLIGIGYIINELENKISKKEEFIATYILEMFILVTSITYFGYGMLTYKTQEKNFELEHFKYLPMSGIENVKETCEYIESQEKKVVILDATAAIYMIPINRYNKNYDMFLKGNLGSKGEEGQIENLNQMSEKIVLIMNDKYMRNWQNPEIVRQYVISNMTKIGEIGIFDIYE